MNNKHSPVAAAAAAAAAVGEATTTATTTTATTTTPRSYLNAVYSSSLLIHTGYLMNVH